MKALEIKVLDVARLTDVATPWSSQSGTSDRHVRSVAQKLVEKTSAVFDRTASKDNKIATVLIDLNEMIVHVICLACGILRP